MINIFDLTYISVAFYDLGGQVSTLAHTVLLWIDASIYFIASLLYTIFINISQSQLFSDEFLQTFALRIYSLLGVIMLFVLAYALLRAIIDPDNATKGDTSLSKIALNLIISLVLIGVLPTVFDYAMRLQTFILEKNIIGVIVFGNDTASSDSNSTSYNKFGNRLAMTVLDGFLYPADESDPDPYSQASFWTSKVYWSEVRADILNDGGYTDYLRIVSFAENIVDGDMTYMILVSSICGVVLVYLMINFCLDLGVRAVKLAFFQLIAPIPVIMRVLPNGKKSFDSWVKATLRSYAEVFIRVFIMYLVVLFAQQIFSLEVFENGPIEGIVILMGLIAFAHEAPKLLEEILGFKGGGIKLGIREKLQRGGAFAAGGIIGSAATAGVRNLVHGAKNNFKFAGDGVKEFKSGNKLKGAAKVLGGGVIGLFNTGRSTFAGSVSGAVRSAPKALRAKDFRETRDAAGSGAAGAVEARYRRADYKEKHRLNIPVVGGVLGTAAAHFVDVGTSASRWSGIGSSTETIAQAQKQIAIVEQKRKTAQDAAEAQAEREKIDRKVSIDFTDSAGKKSTEVIIKSKDTIDPRTGRKTKSSPRKIDLTNVTTNRLELELNAANAEGRVDDAELFTRLIKKSKDQARDDIIRGIDKNGRTRADGNLYQGYNADVRTALTDYANALSQNKSTISEYTPTHAGQDYKDVFKVIDANPKFDVNDIIDKKAQEDLVDLVSNQGKSLMRESKGDAETKLAARIQKEKKSAGGPGNQGH